MGLLGVLTAAAAGAVVRHSGDAPLPPSDARPVRTQAVRVAPDSGKVLQQARRAQRRFERLRRQLLPWSLASGRAACDETVGRFCFWYDDDQSAPKPDHPRIVAERNDLIAALDSAAALFPGDEWIAGQRIRYLVESRRFLDAAWALDQCRAATWWCEALTGFANHVSSDFDAADQAFDRARAAMPDEQRCQWADLTKVLSGDAGRYRAVDCAAREELNRRIWRLADPLYLTPGNERRTEHYSRLVMAHLLERADNAYGLRWGRDKRELLIRHGWEVWWERSRPFAGTIGERVSVIGHHARGGRRFLPPPEVVDATDAVLREWDLDPERPRSLYAPGYATEFEPLEHQLALFRSGDSVVIVAAFPLVDPGDQRLRPWTQRDRRRERALRQPARGLVHAGLVFLTDGDAPPFVGQGLRRDRVARTALTVPAAAGFVSVEALASEDSSAARARYRIDPAQRFRELFALSDLLLVEAAAGLPRRLEEAIPLARGTVSLAPGEPIHLYWEMPGLGPEAPIIALTVVREGKGFFRRAVEFLGFASSDSTAARLEWEDQPPAVRLGPGRSVSIRIPEDDGRYVIILEVRLSDGRTARAERRIVVTQR